MVGFDDEKRLMDRCTRSCWSIWTADGRKNGHSEETDDGQRIEDAKTAIVGTKSELQPFAMTTTFSTTILAVFGEATF